MKRWLRGVLAAGAVSGPITLAASCASPRGTGSETHFVCENDETCIAAHRGSRCVDHRCTSADAGLDASTGSGGTVGNGGAGGGGERSEGGRAGAGGEPSLDASTDGTTQGGSVGGSAGDAGHDGGVDAGCRNDRACPFGNKCLDGECTCIFCGPDVNSLVVDGTRAYYTLSSIHLSYVLEQPLAGGTPSILAREDAGYIASMTADASNLFYDGTAAGRDALLGLAKGGNEIVELDGDSAPYFLVNDGAYVYWVTVPPPFTTWTAKKIANSGGAPVTLTTALFGPMATALGANGFYVLDLTNVGEIDGGPAAQIRRIPLEGGKPVMIATVPPGKGLAVDATDVYSTGHDTVMRVPIDGGPMTVLASGQNNPGRITVDSTHVYWANEGNNPGEGSMMKVPIAGGTPTVLASGLTYPYAIAVDAGFAYWVDTPSGTVKRVPK